MQTLSSNELTITILALLLLLISSFICGKIFELIKAPKVIGEIVGGMLLGGSCLGLIYPELFELIYNGYNGEQKLLDIFYQLGLMLLMFSSGYSTQINIGKENLNTYTKLFIGATFIPTLLGMPFIKMYSTEFIGVANNYEAYALVFLISMSITSIPVISKIFFDIDMMNTKFSNMVLSVSTIQDLCLWIALNLSISLVSGEELNLVKFTSITLLTIGLLIGVKLIERIVNEKHIHIKNNVISISIITLLIITYTLGKLNINIMYSSFIAGYLMKALVGEDNNDIIKIKDFAFAFLSQYILL